MKKKKTPRIEVQLLRGVHTPETITEIVEKLKDSDIILLEFIGTKKLSNQVLLIIDSILANSNNFVDNLESDTSQKNAVINSFHTKIAWDFRRSEKHIMLIDKNDCEDDEETQQLMPGSKLSTMFDDLTKLKKDRYQVIGDLIQSEYDTIKERDDTVLIQIKTVLRIIQQTKEFNARESIKISTVQGLVHDMIAEVQASLPQIRVMQDFYGLDIARELFSTQPTNMLIMEKIDTNGGPVSMHLIDYLLLHILSAAEADDSLKLRENDLKEVLHSDGMSSDVFRRIENSSWGKGIKRIDGYTKDELKQLVDVKIQHL